MTPKMVKHDFKPNVAMKMHESKRGATHDCPECGSENLSFHPERSEFLDSGESYHCHACGHRGDADDAKIRKPMYSMKKKKLREDDLDLDSNTHPWNIPVSSRSNSTPRNCAVCGDKHPTSAHPQSIHTGRALAPENNWANEEVFSEPKVSGMIGYKKTLWNKLKEVESKDKVPSPDTLQKASICGPTNGKKVLDEKLPPSKGGPKNESMKEPEMAGIAAKHGFKHVKSEMPSKNMKVTQMDHPSGHSLKISTFHHDPASPSYHHAGEGNWTLYNKGGVHAMGHEPSHLSHELGKVSGLKEARTKASISKGDSKVRPHGNNTCPNCFGFKEPSKACANCKYGGAGWTSTQ